MIEKKTFNGLSKAINLENAACKNSAVDTTIFLPTYKGAKKFYPHQQEAK
jgi:hypothetical protein